MRRVVRIHAVGGPEVLAIEALELPPPGRHEVQVEHTAIGVHAIDVRHRRGEEPLPTLPHALGVEAVGVVAAVGTGVTGFEPGERVGHAFAGPPGACAEAQNVPAWRLVRLPRALADVDAAAMLGRGLLAECLVRRVHRAGRGQRALVTAAASATGLLLCQWLRHLGVHVLGTVGTAARAEAAQAFGCHQVFVHTDLDIAPAVRAATKGRGVDVVYDGVGGGGLAQSLACLRPRGTLVWYGDVAGAPPADLVARLAAGSVFATRPSWRDYTRTVDELQRAAAALFTVVQQGAVRCIPRTVLPLADVAVAHRQHEARAVTGAQVLVP